MRRDAKRSPVFAPACFLALFFLAAPSSRTGGLPASPGAGYYVDASHPAASDSNPGTEALPWKTIAKANQTLAAGDTVSIKAGTYTSSIAPRNSGAASGPITYRAYGQDTVTIQNASFGIWLDGKSNITVQGIHFFNLDRFMYLENGASYNIIAECTFDQVRNQAEWAGSAIVNQSSHNWVHHCRFSKYGACTGTPPNGNDSGVVLEIGSEESMTGTSPTPDHSDYNLIENNVMFHGGHHVLGVMGRFNVIRNNVLHNEGWSQGRGNRNLYMNGYAIDTGWNLIEGNRFGYAAPPCDDTIVSGAQITSHDNIFRFNSFYFNDLAGLEFSASSYYYQDTVRNHVYNNTFFRNSQTSEPDPGNAAVYFALWSGTLAIKQNIFKNNLYFGQPAAYGVYRVSLADQTFAGEFNGDVSGDPKFAGASALPGDPMNGDYPDLRLVADSPAIDRGVPLASIISPSGSGTTLSVSDAGFFMDGWGIAGVNGDEIQIVGTNQKARISKADYAANTLILDRPLTWTQNQGIALAYAGSAPDAGAFEHGTTTVPTITLTSPNGGEAWDSGSTHAVTWTTTGSVGPMKIEFSADGGAAWSTIADAAPNTGSFIWTIPIAPSAECSLRISESADGSPMDTSDAFFSLLLTKPVIRLSRGKMSFGALSGAVTPGQSTTVANAGGGALDWTAAPSAGWITISPDRGSSGASVTIGVNPSGWAAGTYEGSVAFSDANAANSPQRILVNLTVIGPQKGQPPFGAFETPVDGASGISGAIPVTGWALDDIEVSKVEIWREPVLSAGESDTLVYIGDAAFVEGARPDVELEHPAYPLNSKAGWGYMLLTNVLPNRGNGTYTLLAIAADRDGHAVALGTKTIACDNAQAVKPFGTIDTPAQGGDASGNPYLNFGWVLTPLPKMVPRDGSTVSVYIDSVPKGALSASPNVYNQYRSDVAGAFPGLNNAGGAVGVYFLDTTAYANGVHTIHWIAYDDAGEGDGIGSRFFNIANPTGASSGTADEPDAWDLASIPKSRLPVRLTTGLNLKAEPRELLPDDAGAYRVKIPELGRIEIELDGADRTPPALRGTRYSGCRLVGDSPRPLPVGSTLDRRTGRFSWLPGPGFLGVHDLTFIARDPQGRAFQTNIRVVIEPKDGRRPSRDAAAREMIP